MTTPRPVPSRRKAAPVITAALLAACSFPFTPALSYDRPPLIRPGPFARAGECAGLHSGAGRGTEQRALPAVRPPDQRHALRPAAARESVFYRNRYGLGWFAHGCNSLSPPRRKDTNGT